MKANVYAIFAFVIGVPLMGVGCTPRPSPQSPPSDIVVNVPVKIPIGTQRAPSSQKLNPDSPPPTISEHTSVPNPIYHPGTSDYLDITGSYVGKESIKLTGKITFIVAKETEHERSVNAMNVAIEMQFPDGTKRQLQGSSVYGKQSDGSLKLLYKESDSGRQWVESSTLPKEPKDFTDGQAIGGEVKYSDGSRSKMTSAVSKDGDYIKVIEITHTTEAKGEDDLSETYWYDISTGRIVRYSGLITESDGSQFTIEGK